MKSSYRTKKKNLISVEMTEKQAKSIANCIRGQEFDGHFVRSDNVMVKNSHLLEFARELENILNEIEIDQKPEFMDEGDED